MTLVMLMSVSYAYAENFTVSVNGDGFSQSSLTIGQGDSVTFTTDIDSPYSVAITDVLWQIQTGMIGHYAFDSDNPVTWTFDVCQTHIFEDQYNQFSPMTLIVDCSTQESSSDAPNYTGTYTLLSLQEELAEVTADLNLAIEEAGILQNTVNSLTSQLTSSQSEAFTLEQLLTSAQLELSQYGDSATVTNQQIQELTSSVDTLEINVSALETANSDLTSERDALVIERDGWKQLSDNWYAVALEQVRVMVEVLGL